MLLIAQLLEAGASRCGGSVSSPISPLSLLRCPMTELWIAGLSSLRYLALEDQLFGLAASHSALGEFLALAGFFSLRLFSSLALSPLGSFSL